MADKKFSQFTLQPTPAGSDELVGLSNGANVKLEINTINRNDLDGTLAIASGGTGATTAGVSTVGALIDETSQVIGDSVVIQDDGSGNSVLATGSAVNLKPPKCQVTINGTAGISNTNNNSDFRVPYNTVVVNDPNYFTVTDICRAPAGALQISSGNGEATINGSQIMAVNANDVCEITAFHTGATGGNGSQGFPVNANTFFNEPTLTIIKLG